MTKQTDLFDNRKKKMLHIAPEFQLGRLFQQSPAIDYLSGDLSSSAAMVEMDITDIGYPDNSFDVIYCSHVLEHVPDDRKAMREFCRVLKTDGWAILQVPITSDATVEDWTVTAPHERERLFGQADHVRRYGLDYKDRLMECGFDVTVTRYSEHLGRDATTRFGLMHDEDIYFCKKRH